MPTASRPHPEHPAPDRRGGCAARDREPRRVIIEPGGPTLVEGPVEVVLPDGRTVTSDRFMVAICTCRRSGSYPWCDTSHRRRTHTGQEAATGPETARSTVTSRQAEPERSRQREPER
ncbi:CDGSH iron-sulfur domain-containing protein [Streptomyces sp. NPDC004647]|uniref:CDGSH iron-sulfur domain-containing protein n=1 Tax=Streptomyces sp. NPDC004647 TaxID=3154671 RepID=UPI00339F3B80